MNMVDKQNSTLILIPGRGMGQGPVDLKERLADKWLQLVMADGRLPGAVALYSEGIHLATRSSPVLESLQTLEERGVYVILCKTCIDYYGLSDEIAVGVVGGMGDIIAAQWAAKKVITL
jgi:sulfur relay (sulfurtransferase) complex TusBCD TusD component (DsrE family)